MMVARSMSIQVRRGGRIESLFERASAHTSTVNDDALNESTAACCALPQTTTQRRHAASAKHATKTGSLALSITNAFGVQSCNK